MHTRKSKRKSYKGGYGSKHRSSARYKQKRSDSYKRPHRSSSRSDKSYHSGSKQTAKLQRDEQKHRSGQQQQATRVKKPQQQNVGKPEPKTEAPQATTPVKPKEFPKAKIEAPDNMIQIETKKED